MFNKKIILFVALLVILILLLSGCIEKKKENNLTEEANNIILKIDKYKKVNSKNPDNLEEIGVKKYDESGPIYYNLKEDNSFTLTHSCTLDTCMTYNSETKK